MPEPAATLYDRIGGHAGLSRVVKWFYAKARFDPLLEPIFKAHVEIWSQHLNLIIDFWARMIGGPSTWTGGMGRHVTLDLRPEHYETWLRIWDQNCRDLLPAPEAEEMCALAHRIGDDLQAMTARAATRKRPAAALGVES